MGGARGPLAEGVVMGGSDGIESYPGEETHSGLRVGRPFKFKMGQRGFQGIEMRKKDREEKNDLFDWQRSTLTSGRMLGSVV